MSQSRIVLERKKGGGFRYHASNLWLSWAKRLEKSKDAFLKYDELVQESRPSDGYYPFGESPKERVSPAALAAAKAKVNMAMGEARVAAQAVIPSATLQTPTGVVTLPLLENWENVYEDPYSNGRSTLISAITIAIGHCWAMYETELETDSSFVGLLRGFFQLAERLREALNLPKGSAASKGLTGVVVTVQALIIGVAASLLATLIWEFLR